MSEKKFEQVARHLYRRQYQTASGDWSTLFYAIFTCWDGRRRTFPLGDSLAIARDRLGELRNLNGRRFDFDADKQIGMLPPKAPARPSRVIGSHEGESAGV